MKKIFLVIIFFLAGCVDFPSDNLRYNYLEKKWEFVPNHSQLNYIEEWEEK